MLGSRIKCLNLFLVPWEESIYNQDSDHHPRGILQSFTEASSVVRCSWGHSSAPVETTGSRQTGTRVLQGALAFLRLSGKALWAPDSRLLCHFHQRRQTVPIPMSYTATHPPEYPTSGPLKRNRPGVGRSCVARIWA